MLAANRDIFKLHNMVLKESYPPLKNTARLGYNDIRYNETTYLEPQVWNRNYDFVNLGLLLFISRSSQLYETSVLIAGAPVEVIDCTPYSGKVVLYHTF